MADVNRELADFLRRARAACDPGRAALPDDGRVRRVKGLRREEVALLAGVSTDYYTRLEQGRPIVPSTQVIEALGRALDLDRAERIHLRDLFSISGSARPRPRTHAQKVRPGLHQLLEALESQPALILGRNTDVLAANAMARALLTDFDRMPPRERNYARWILCSAEARELFADWEEQARNAVASLRLEVGRDPDDPDTKKLVGYLTEASSEFRTWWTEHHVHQRTFGSKRLRHPLVGELTVQYESLTLPGDTEQALYIYTGERGSASREALAVLSSWTTRPTLAV